MKPHFQGILHFTGFVRLLWTGLAMASACASAAPTPIKWVCIGNSITAGYPQANLTYVTGTNRLDNLLGPQFLLENDGVSGATLLKKGDNPYWKQGKFTHIFALKPDIISIELGTNDTKPGNWARNADFVADLTALVDTLSDNISPKPQIWLFLPPPIFTNTFGIDDAVMTNGVIPRIRQVAAAKGLKLIDTNTPLRAHAAYFSDGVHFTAAGADALAGIVYQAFLAQVTRVACIGNSITFGSTVSPSEAYPVRLNMLLGRDFYVRNEGRSGAYMQKPGRAPYWGTPQFTDVFGFKPNLITISLGTNDSRATQWNTARFVADYKAMIDTLANAFSPKPKFWLLKPMPAWMFNGAWNFDNDIAGNGVIGFTIRDSVGKAVQQVADQKGWPAVDLYAPMLMGKPYAYNVTPAWVPDGVHPNALGQDTLAATVNRAMLQPVGIAPPRTVWSPPVKAAKAAKAAEAGRRFSVDGKTVRVPAASPHAPRVIDAQGHKTAQNH